MSVDPNEDSNRALSTWGEIADHLSVSMRTAQGWSVLLAAQPV